MANSPSIRNRSVRARWVVPVDGASIEGGVVEISDGRIAAVRRGGAGEKVDEDLGDAVLLPGFVNAHTHLEFSLLREPLGGAGMPLVEWIRLVIAHRGNNPEGKAEAVAAGLAESLAAGVTTVADIATGGVLPPSPVVPFVESIGFSAARVDSAFGQLMDDFEKASRAGRLAGLSPHAPYTVHPRLVERIVNAASERGAPVAMHLAESTDELRLLSTGDGPFQDLLEERGMWDADAIPHGSTPTDYIRLLAQAPRSLVIHGNYLTGEEIRLVARHSDRMAIVYCPRTHSFFGHDAHPLGEMLAAGARVVLGTDSRARTPIFRFLLSFATRPSFTPGWPRSGCCGWRRSTRPKPLVWPERWGPSRPGNEPIWLPCPALPGCCGRWRGCFGSTAGPWPSGGRGEHPPRA